MTSGNRGVRQPYRDPVRLPDGVEHGSPSAYNKHRCRCAPCFEWRRGYDRMKRERAALLRKERRMTDREYLLTRGIELWGPGPFSRNPTVLANIVRRYLGDER